jgi:hypothetical protein
MDRKICVSRAVESEIKLCVESLHVVAPDLCSIILGYLSVETEFTLYMRRIPSSGWWSPFFSLYPVCWTACSDDIVVINHGQSFSLKWHDDEKATPICLNVDPVRPWHKKDPPESLPAGFGRKCFPRQWTPEDTQKRLHVGVTNEAVSFFHLDLREQPWVRSGSTNLTKKDRELFLAIQEKHPNRIWLLQTTPVNGQRVEQIKRLLGLTKQQWHGWMDALQVSESLRKNGWQEG